MSGVEAAMAAYPAITSILATAGTAYAVGEMAKPKGTPQAPPITPPKVMPNVDDEASKRARRRSLAAQVTRSGRESTVLADPPGGTLGAG